MLCIYAPIWAMYWTLLTLGHVSKINEQIKIKNRRIIFSLPWELSTTDDPAYCMGLAINNSISLGGLEKVSITHHSFPSSHFDFLSSSSIMFPETWWCLKSYRHANKRWTNTQSLILLLSLLLLLSYTWHPDRSYISQIYSSSFSLKKNRQDSQE